jgi:hypothetical protein
MRNDIWTFIFKKVVSTLIVRPPKACAPVAKGFYVGENSQTIIISGETSISYKKLIFHSLTKE